MLLHSVGMSVSEDGCTMPLIALRPIVQRRMIFDWLSELAPRLGVSGHLVPEA